MQFILSSTGFTQTEEVTRNFSRAAQELLSDFADLSSSFGVIGFNLLSLNVECLFTLSPTAISLCLDVVDPVVDLLNNTYTEFEDINVSQLCPLCQCSVYMG